MYRNTEQAEEFLLYLGHAAPYPTVSIQQIGSRPVAEPTHSPGAHSFALSWAEFLTSCGLVPSSTTDVQEEMRLCLSSVFSLLCSNLDVRFCLV